MTDTTPTPPQPFDPAPIPPQFRAVALIGREVRIVEWVPDEETEEDEE